LVAVTELDPLEAARRLNEAYNRRDLDAIVAMYCEEATRDVTRPAATPAV